MITTSTYLYDTFWYDCWSSFTNAMKYNNSWLILCILHDVRKDNGGYIPDDIFRCIFVNETFRILTWFIVA